MGLPAPPPKWRSQGNDTGNIVQAPRSREVTVAALRKSTVKGARCKIVYGPNHETDIMDATGIRELPPLKPKP
ncbi:MAG: hypothetical protein ACYSVY_12225 [Planctomycetota bacterium]|jgi:hypothetical protein